MNNISHASLRDSITPSYTEDSERVFYKLAEWSREIRAALDKNSLAQHIISYDEENQDIIIKRGDKELSVQRFLQENGLPYPLKFHTDKPFALRSSKDGQYYITAPKNEMGKKGFLITVYHELGHLMNIPGTCTWSVQGEKGAWDNALKINKLIKAATGIDALEEFADEEEACRYMNCYIACYVRKEEIYDIDLPLYFFFGLE